MKMEINIEQYLSEEEIATICESEIRKLLRAKLERQEDLQRFLSNASYRFVERAVDELIEDSAVKQIASKIPGIIDNLGVYNVFRPKNAWEREESKGWDILRKALDDSEPLIRARVVELVSKLDLYMIRDAMMEMIDNTLDNLKRQTTGDGQP